MAVGKTAFNGINNWLRAKQEKSYATGMEWDNAVDRVHNAECLNNFWSAHTLLRLPLTDRLNLFFDELFL